MLDVVILASSEPAVMMLASTSGPRSASAIEASSMLLLCATKLARYLAALVIS